MPYKKVNTLEELFMVLVSNNPKPLLKKYSLFMKKITLIKNLLSLSACLGLTQLNAQVDTAKTAGKDTTNNNFNVPIFSTSGADADSDMDQQDASALLQSSRDVFVQFSSFHFSIGRFRMRGFQNENNLVMINGVNVSNLETGNSTWSSWGGLNDVTRFTESRFGIMPCRTGFSGIGGYVNIDSKASSFRKGTRVTYAFSNRIFAHRVSVTHSTGMMQNGWALTISASTRQGNEVYIPGTYFNGNSIYAAIDKKITEKHLLSFTSFYAPIEQGRNSTEIQEAFTLTGNNYYNSFWGYQNGKVRNASIARTNRPSFMLAHNFNINQRTKLTTSVFYSFGKSSLSGLNWNNAPNPRPDYYRYFPSYFYGTNNIAGGDLQTTIWQNNDPAVTQINWDKMIALNQANITNLPGTTGVNTNEIRSRYVLENRIQNSKTLTFNSIYNSRIDNVFISAGLNGSIYSNNYYKEIEDLLGGTFWLDVDQFAQNQGVTENFASNNLDDPDKPIRLGDKYGYDYSIKINRAELWSQIEYNLNKFDFYGGLTISNNTINRVSKLANGKFPDDSKGESPKLNFFNYGVKGGLTYKINGRHFVTANGTYLTRTPEVNNLYVSPITRNDLVPNIKNEIVYGLDVNYLIKYPTFKFRATYYNSQINNQITIRTYFHEVYNNMVNYIMTGVNQNFQGIELGIDKTLFTSHNIQLAFGMSNNIYSNRPTALALKNNDRVNLFEDRIVYLKNYRVGGGPQTVAGLGYRYLGKKFWSVGLAGSYFDDSYLEPNPDRRTAESTTKFQTNEIEQLNVVIGQEKLPSFFVLNANASKSFRIKRKYYLNFNLTIMNLLNNKNIKVFGFEQLRWDMGNINKFPNKYQYMLGTTYMATASFSF